MKEKNSRHWFPRGLGRLGSACLSIVSGFFLFNAALAFYISFKGSKAPAHEIWASLVVSLALLFSLIGGKTARLSYKMYKGGAALSTSRTSADRSAPPTRS